MYLLAVRQLTLVVVLLAGTASAQATLVTCTSQTPKYYTVTVTQTVTMLLMRPDDPPDLDRRLDLLGRSIPPPPNGYLPPPAHSHLPPPAHGYLPPPAHGYLPPPAHDYLPPRPSTPITITPTPVITTRPTAENIIVVPCRCNTCSILVQEDPCVCVPDFGCGGLDEVRSG